MAGSAMVLVPVRQCISLSLLACPVLMVKEVGVPVARDGEANQRWLSWWWLRFALSLLMATVLGTT